MTIPTHTLWYLLDPAMTWHSGRVALATTFPPWLRMLKISCKQHRCEREVSEEVKHMHTEFWTAAAKMQLM